MRLTLITSLCSLLFSFSLCDYTDNKIETCNLPSDLKDEIGSYQEIVDRIINETVYGERRGFVYEELSAFVDEFGNRMTGTKNLENSIDYMIKKLEDYSLENVHGENVTVSHWVRGKEVAMLTSPRVQKLTILGLGGSVGTPQDGISAEAIVVNSFVDLERKASKVKGKIVVFNEKYVSYGETVKYRDYAAVRAAKHGAVATLVSSVTPFSLNTPHTGMQDYSPNVTKIPTAAITIEDAHMLARMQQRGKKLRIKLKMIETQLPAANSRNIVAEIIGKTTPKKVVVVSGHIDSWDVGQGAMDDGGGAFISWGALAILKKLNLRPRRTLRSILWTAEEPGLLGAQAYAQEHKNEMDDFNMFMESDEGTFTPQGLRFVGSEGGACVLEEILKLMKPLNSTNLEKADDAGSDIMVFLNTGVPLASLLNANEKYFWYHHTEADTMDIEDPDQLDKCTALWAAASYVIADLSIDIPRK